MTTPDHQGPLLVSACLADVRCRYDGAAKPTPALAGRGGVLALCPEVAGGLGVPREPAEIVGGDGEDVLAGRARVVTRGGRDVTAEFVRGAESVLDLARRSGVRLAVLKARSPSCGSGTLAAAGGATRPGTGVLAALLRRNGIEVVSDETWRSTKS